jgi:hypothetical protein
MIYRDEINQIKSNNLSGTHLTSSIPTYTAFKIVSLPKLLSRTEVGETMQGSRLQGKHF